MPRYYFDLHDELGTATDEEGLELSSMSAVQGEAAKSVGDMARDAIMSAPATGVRRRMAIEVRDASGPVMQVICSVAIETFDARQESHHH